MKYIFWDFNGTVLDDVDLCLNILNEMLIEEQRKTIDKKTYLNLFTFPIRDYYAKVFDLTVSDFDILAHRFIKRYQPRSLDCKLNDHVIEMIDFYHEKGYQNILLSASEEKNLLEQLDHFGIKDKFTYILGTSNIYAKSKVEVARNFIEKQKIDTINAYMIGDTLHDAEVAEKLGLKVILYSGGHQDKIRFKNHQTIDDFKELINII